MSTSSQIIPCPDCGSDIVFTVELLLTGATFKCSNCQVSISLSEGSAPVVKETLDKFNELKTGLLNKDQQ